MALEVLKTNGKTERFAPEKVEASVKRAGASEALARKIVAEVERRGSRMKGAVTTKQIYKWVNGILEREAPAISMRYDLRAALMRLGPEGFPFEKYIAAVMREYGYKTELPEELQGACITHEVDVSMEKDGRLMMIEAKFRKDMNMTIGIKDTMSTWARYLDLVEGASLGLAPHFDEAWLVTNATFSDQSLEYGHCKNMVMIGWNHPRERTLAAMIDLKRLYPVTALKSCTDAVRDTLIEHGILLCSQIADALGSGRLPLSEHELRALERDAALILKK